MLKKKKQKSKVEIAIHSRALKKRKKHKGKVSGSRFNLNIAESKKNNKTAIDDRIGSKKPIPLVLESSDINKKAKSVNKSPNKKSRQELLEELSALENNNYLNTLIDKLEIDANLTEKEEADFDRMMDRLEWLMEKLGIEVDDKTDESENEDDDDERNKFDIMHLLK